MALTLVLITLPSIALSQSTAVEITNIKKMVEGNSVDFHVTIRTGEYEKTGTLEVGSESTGYKSLEVYLDRYSEETYELTGFSLPDKETYFSVSLENNGVNLVEPHHIKLKPTAESSTEGGNGWIKTITDNAMVLGGIIILTIVGVILITPFLYHSEGNKPFKEDIDLEDIKKKS